MISDKNMTIQKFLVFKTNISTDQDLNIAAKILAQVNEILRWNVDRHDIDNVLRVEGCGIVPNDIIKIFREAGFQCEELPD
jgi:hypothetical protein